MAYVICICGAGGKTTYCYERAHEYAKQGKKVCVMTLTHMFYDKKVYDIDSLDEIKEGFVYTFGNIFDIKITPVDAISYKKICDRFDYVIIESDGSKMMPLKIPKIKREPVIPLNVSEIVIIYNLSATGRKIKDICFRFDEYKNDEYIMTHNIVDDTIVTEEIIKDLYNHYYIEYLKNRYDGAKVYLHKVDMALHKNYKKYKNIAFALLASGESKRYNADKLNESIFGKKIYKIMSEKLFNAKKMLCEKLENLGHTINIDIVIVTRFDYILNDNDIKENAIMLKNNNYKEGISSSIKCTGKLYDKDTSNNIVFAKAKTKNQGNYHTGHLDNRLNRGAHKYDAIVYFNSDMPLLCEQDIVNMIYNTMCSNDEIGAMCYETPRTPAFFSKKYKNDIMQLVGDKGAKVLFDKYISSIYRYHIDEGSLSDIDTKDDFERIKRLYDEK